MLLISNGRLPVFRVVSRSIPFASISWRLILGSREYGTKDLRVAGAAAEIAGHPFDDIGFSGIRLMVEQAASGHDLAGRARTALQAVVVDEGALDGVELRALRESFDRAHRAAVG
jgi:hypothetical protein